jgi:hypothetical protein
VVTAVTGPVAVADAVRAALEALVGGWPIAGARLVSLDGTLTVVAGEVGGTGRRVPLVVSGNSVGHADLFGEVGPVDDEMMQLMALRMAAGRPTGESTDRDGVSRAEPKSDSARSGGHGPDAS